MFLFLRSGSPRAPADSSTDRPRFFCAPYERLAGLSLGRAHARTRVRRIRAAPPRGGRGDWGAPTPWSFSLSLFPPTPAPPAPAPAPIVDKRRYETEQRSPETRYRWAYLPVNSPSFPEQLEEEHIGAAWGTRTVPLLEKPWVTTGCFVSVADWTLAVVRLRGRSAPPRRPRVIRYHMMFISVRCLRPIMTAFRLSLCLCVSPLRKVWPRWFGFRTAAGRREVDVPLLLLPENHWCLPTKAAANMGHSPWVEADQRYRRRRPWEALFSREWCEQTRPGSLDLTGDSSFPRSVRGSKPRPEPSKMGKCDGRCTLLVICSLQLVSLSACSCLYCMCTTKAASHISQRYN